MDGFNIFITEDTSLYRVDPRIKVAGLAWFSIIISVANWPGLLFSTLVLTTVVIFSEIPLRIYRPVFIMTLWLGLFYSIASGWIWTDGMYFWEGHWSKTGLEQAGLMIWKIVIIFILTRLFMAVTPPLEQGTAIAFFLAPLTKITPRAADFALLITLTLRFIPILAEESEILWKARAARGVLPEKRIWLMLELAKLFPPLLLLSMRRAEEVADNLLARGYAPGRYRVISLHKWTKKDSYALVILLVWGVIVFVFR